MKNALSFFIISLFLFHLIHSHDNGLATTPPMGWNTWYQYFCDVSQDLVIGTIDSMISTNLYKYGYQYINLDDCWSDKQGRDIIRSRLVPDPTRFSKGMNYLSDYAHQNGLKMGIYSDVGTKTCGGYPGSYLYYDIDAQTFADWGIDFLKLDFCNINNDILKTPWVYYKSMSEALNMTGRPMLFSICNWGVKAPWTWAPSMSNMWRTTGDSEVFWPRVMQVLTENRYLSTYSGVNHWNDPDMLLVGVNGTKDGKPISLTERESRAQFAIWCVINAPLLLSNDLRKLDNNSWIWNVIANPEVIAVNQDSIAVQGQMIKEVITGTFSSDGKSCTSSSCSRTEIWMKPYTNNPATYAIVFFNRANDYNQNDSKFKSLKMTINWDQIGMPGDTNMNVRNLWKKKDEGTFQKSFTTDLIDPHDVVMITITPNL